MLQTSPTPSVTDSDTLDACEVYRNDELADDPSDDETVETERPLEQATPISVRLPKPKSLKRQHEDEELQLIKELSDSFHKREHKKEVKTADEGTDIDAFGCYIAESLRNVDPIMRHVAQLNISHILFQAQMRVLVPNPQLMCPQQQAEFPPVTAANHSHPTNNLGSAAQIP